MRERFKVTVMTPAAAIARANASSAGLFVLADISDNPGGGAPGDGTQIIKALLDVGARGVGVAVIYDPEVVDQAVKAGPRARIRVALGGKTEPACLHGEPLRVEAVVKTISDGCYISKGPIWTGLRMDIGRTVVLDANGVRIIVSERRVQATDPEVFRRHGIEPLDQKMLVLKSSLHFRAGFAPLAHEIIQLDLPGLMSPNFATFPYKNLGGPRWPLDPEA
jgi:microcystin degradation protein MlrC